MLPDILKPSLELVFCGTAAGKHSAEIGQYYAGPGNKFWKTLHDVGLTPRVLRPNEAVQLLSHSIGLTDLAKGVSGMDHELPSGSMDRDLLESVIVEYCPKRIAFNGKKAAQVALNQKGFVDYGKFSERVFDNTEVWVLPSTSGAGQRYWDITHWAGLAKAIRSEVGN